jgi:hypothetical protein
MSSLVHPITFSFPEEKVVTSLSPKTKLMSGMLPGVASTYIYNCERDYYDEYRRSIFATTTQKGGWDCMRHYEIIANGCIPYFPNIESCPEQTMVLLPKWLMLEGNALYDSLKHKQLQDLTQAETDECTALAWRFVEYLLAHLTTRKVAMYMLERANRPACKAVLYLTHDPNPDYLRCLTLHGLKSLFGARCHDAPHVRHLYQHADMEYSNLYGRGITYTNLLETTARDPDLDATLEVDIAAKRYDIVVYGSYHRGMPHYELVRSVYQPDEVILLCGEDIHHCNYHEWTARGHHVFVRELV